MSVDYTLAKELKDAGFWQHGAGTYLLKDGMEVGQTEFAAYVPTLSELIEACGNDFGFLGRIGSKYVAVARSDWTADFIRSLKDLTLYDAPEEAVARLWLPLQKAVVK